jgi:transposase-like protein
MTQKIDNTKINAAVDLLIESDIDLSNALGENGLIKQLSKRILEKALQIEMDDHLGYSRYDRSELQNARNGAFQKTLITNNGTIELDVPRDRNGGFEPAIIKKKQSRVAGLDQKIVSLYAKGMSLSDIKTQLQELYDADISESLISKITDGVADEVKAWQNRALESVYPIVFFDCLVVKVRHEKRIINKAVYVALGIDLSGRKDILGLWISENEGAKFWLGNLTEMKNRGMTDMLIACTDNLTGMSDAISAVYPKCEHQLCIVHQIRNSLKFVSYKDRKELVADLKPIYQAATEDEAQEALDAFDRKWSKQYPQIAKSWYNNWENLIIFLQYPKAIRKIIYTTNAIEPLNSQLRKVTKHKRVFPSDESVFKTLYFKLNYITAKCYMPIRDWNEAMAHFLIKFDDRIQNNI